jgi:ABC-type Fe3+-hydroxamate transport system substrate-binding protein
VSDRTVDAGPSMRIVSLVPSVTETLSAWGRTPIACTRFCERPDLPHVGGTKDPDVGRIAELAPDLVVVDAEENRREDHDALVAAGLDVHVLRIRSLADVDPAMTALSARLAARWVPLDLGARTAESTRAFVPIWRRPWMALGVPTYGSSLLAHLGVDNIFEDRGPYPTVSLEEAADRRPRLVIAPSEPYPFTRRQLPELESVGPTLFVDGRDLFWWGVRTPGALDRLGSQLPGR